MATRREITANDTPGSTDNLAFLHVVSGTVTITLDTDANQTWEEATIFTIVNESGNDVTIDPAGGVNLNGSNDDVVIPDDTAYSVSNMLGADNWIGGSTSPEGAVGGGLPVGGTATQLLAKIDATDYNVEWVDPPAGGGASFPTAWDPETGATYTVLAADMGKIKSFSDNSGPVVTVDTVGSVGEQVGLHASGAQGLTVQAGTATLVPAGDRTISEGQMVWLFQSSAGVFQVLDAPKILSTSEVTAASPSVIPGLVSPYNLRESIRTWANGPGERIGQSTNKIATAYGGDQQSTGVGEVYNAAGKALVWLVRFGEPCTLTGWEAYVQQAGAAGTEAIAAIYEVAAGLTIGDLVGSLGLVDIASTGYRNTTGAVVSIEKPWYYIAVQTEDASLQLRRGTEYSAYHPIEVGSSGLVTAVQWTETITWTGSAPVFSSPTTLSNANPPSFVKLEVA